MAGMPYPNPTDPELQERMQHMQFFSNSTVDKLAGRDWGRIYYDDLCFKVRSLGSPDSKGKMSLRIYCILPAGSNI